MTKTKLFIIPISFFCAFSHAQTGNVGINTKTPRVKTDVAGTYRSGKIISGTTPAITAAQKDRYLLLIHSATDNTVKRINPVQATAPGIASLITFRLTNVNRDWVEGFNTRINSSNYSLMVLSAYFDRDLIGSAIAVPTYGVKNNPSTSEWIIYADYSDINTTTNGTWNIVCAVYPKTYVKIFPEHGPFDLNNAASGTDTSPILQ